MTKELKDLVPVPPTPPHIQADVKDPWGKCLVLSLDASASSSTSRPSVSRTKFLSFPPASCPGNQRECPQSLTMRSFGHRKFGKRSVAQTSHTVHSQVCHDAYLFLDPKEQGKQGEGTKGSKRKEPSGSKCLGELPRTTSLSRS